MKLSHQRILTELVSLTAMMRDALRDSFQDIEYRVVVVVVEVTVFVFLILFV